MVGTVEIICHRYLLILWPHLRKSLSLECSFYLHLSYTQGWVCLSWLLWLRHWNNLIILITTFLAGCSPGCLLLNYLEQRLISKRAGVAVLGRLFLLSSPIYHFTQFDNSKFGLLLFFSKFLSAIVISWFKTASFRSPKRGMKLI